MKNKNKISKNDLYFIISQGEGQFTKFKEKIDKSFAKEIVAFANSAGGRILIGISDDGEIKGKILTNKLKSQIIDTALNCDPKIIVQLQEIENIVIVSISESKNKPHSCSSGFYLRIGANSQKLTRNEIFQFAISQEITNFDEEINHKFIYPDDFDETKFTNYLSAANIENIMSNEDILINLNVAEYENEKLKLNNTGVLFFAKNPSKFFLSSKVVCGEFAYNEKDKILDKKVYDDGLLENIKEAINFITKRIKVEFVIKSAERKEIPQFPEEAYREAVVNAIMHRDYVDKSSDVFVEVYRNKIIITNPGGLVKWLKKEDFGKISKTRNTIIASLLSRTKYVEKMGTGIFRMNNAMKKAGLPELLFDYDDYTFFTTINDKSDTPEKENDNDHFSNDLQDFDVNADEFQSIFGINSEYFRNKFGIKVYETLILLYKNPKITAKDISIKIGSTQRSVENYIKIIKENNLVKRIGSKKTGYWKIVIKENNEK